MTLYYNNDNKVFQREAAQIVRDAVSRLPQPEKEIIRRIYFKDLTQFEIADKLNIHINKVRSIKRSGLKILSKNKKIKELSLEIW